MEKRKLGAEIIFVTVKSNLYHPFHSSKAFYEYKIILSIRKHYLKMEYV